MNEELKLEVEEEKCMCGAPAGDLYPCPYQEDVNGLEVMCNCCKDCRQACLDDI